MTRVSITAGVALVMAIGSAVAVVTVHHARRSLFVDLHRDALQSEWGRLQLEQGTWATNERIERLATEKLELHVPDAAATVLVVAERGH